MNVFNPALLNDLYYPPSGSHKGQNGKVMVIGGSKLFHAASLWALSIASKIVDMVFYASVPENNEIVLRAKEEFRNGIVIPREHIEDYMEEADVVIVGPGLMRKHEKTHRTEANVQNISDIVHIPDEGEQTYWLTKLLLERYPNKKFVIDAGSLQMMEPDWLLGLQTMAIVTPHHQEFETLFGIPATEESIVAMAKKYHVVILAKGICDIVASPTESVLVQGGNAGMTKGGTGDVLAGLVGALYAKNNAFLAACAGSFFNKKAGESLFEKVGYVFNASDLVNAIPGVMHKFLTAQSVQQIESTGL